MAVERLVKTPADLAIPAYLMCPPFTLSTDDPNNVWMHELSDKERKINKEQAFIQFMDLYNFLAGEAMVYLLPAMGKFQDQVYTANLGLFLPHIKQKAVIVIANYKSEPRQGEDKIGKQFLEMVGYKVIQPPAHWEGEAETKFLRGNIYIGGYGQRSDIETYKWMGDKLGMEIILLKMEDEYLYHLDCSVFVVNEEQVMMGTEFFSEKEIGEVEKHAEIIEVSDDDCYNGICNSVRLGNVIMSASDIHKISKKDARYEEEKHKVETLNKICAKVGMEPLLFNLSEYMKSGAMLSCMIMHLNRLDIEPLL